MDGFRYYFTPLTGVLFTFPSRYWFTIGRRVVFSLGRWSSQIPTRLHVSGGTRVFLARSGSFVYGAVTLYGRPFHAVRLEPNFVTRWVCVGTQRKPTTPIQQR